MQRSLQIRNIESNRWWSTLKNDPKEKYNRKIKKKIRGKKRKEKK
jgi:hypothetical protein